MKKIMLVIAGVLVSCLTFSQDPGWPRQLKHDGSVMVIYPPQVENWQDYQSINFRMAFTLTPVNQTKQVVGVLYINATTISDTYNHMVTLSNMNIVSVHFPGLDDATSCFYGKDRANNGRCFENRYCFNGKNCGMHAKTTDNINSECSK